MRLDQLIGMVNNLQRAIEEQDASFLEIERGYKTDKIVDVLEFASSKEFFGYRGLWVSEKEDLWRIWHSEPPPFEVVFGGAEGTAKSTKSVICLGYCLYLCSQLHSPQIELNCIPDDDLFMLVQSMRLDTAETALFDRLKTRVDNSPYFQKNFPRNQKINSILEFPGHIFVKPLTGATDAALGKNIIFLVITEINFMPVHRKSVHLQHSDKELFDVGNQMYTNGYGRITGRFSKFIDEGNFIGRIIVDSARSHVGDFTDRKIEEAATDPRILVIERSLWNARAHEYPKDGPIFYVQLAADFKPPRILNNLQDADGWVEEFAADPSKFRDNTWLKECLDVIAVPERHRKEFEKDLEEALKKKAGVPSTSTGRFLPFPEKIRAAQVAFVERTGGLSLFTVEKVQMSRDVDLIGLVNHEYVKQLVLEGQFNWAVHVDTALGKIDAAGLGVARIIGSKVVENSLFYNMNKQEVQEFKNVESPVFCADGAIRIIAPPGGQIDLNKIRDFVLYLKTLVNIRYASADWIESISMLQAWRDEKIVAGKVSVDRTPDAYFEFKHAIQEERVLLPPNSILEEELRDLRRIAKSGSISIDHGPTGTKDVVDSVCGAISVLKRMEGRYRLMNREPEPPEGEQKQQESAPQRRSPMVARGMRR